MTEKKIAHYGSSHGRKMIKQFFGMLKMIHPLLEEKYGCETALKLRGQAMEVFQKEILPGLPYIGGQRNTFSVYLEQSSMALALYRAVQRHGSTLEEAGQIIHRGMILVMGRYPKGLFHLYGRWMNSRLRYGSMRKSARLSRLRKFPADWVYEFVEGEPGQFDYGLDMHECGILKFMAEQGAPELTPYLCAVDYITYHAMGVELQRTETLVAGCPRCSFRMIVKGNPPDPSQIIGEQGGKG